MKTLLVAIDFSDATPPVIETAAELAGAFASSVHLLHVAPAEPAFVGYEPGPQSVRDATAEELESKHQRLDTLRQGLEARGLEANALLVQGVAAEKILEKVAQLGADLVVMGSHGHSAVYHLLVGSVTEGVLRDAPCPVLVVPSPRPEDKR